MSETGVEPSRPWRDELREFTSELGRLIALHRELAEREIRHDQALVVRSLKIGGAGAVLLLVGLPVLLSAAAHALASVTAWSMITWLLILGGACVLPGALLVAAAWRKVRVGFCGLRHTRAELSEDLVWLREWSESPQPPA